MKYEIVPSMLSVENELARYIDMLKGKVESVHIDVMDGIFVDRKAFGVDAIVELDTYLKLVVHLMAVNPESLVPDYALAGADTITFHVEAVKDPAAVIKMIKDEGCKAGISLKPGTPLEKIKPFLKDADVVLVMTVEPGRGGQEIIPAMLDRIKEIRKLNRKIDIEVDGGINKYTINDAKKAGANKFVVGTAIFSQKDPLKAIEELKKMIG